MPCLTSLAEMSHRGALPVCLSMMIGPKVTWLSRPLSSFRSTATCGCDPPQNVAWAQRSLCFGHRSAQWWALSVPGLYWAPEGQGQG